MAAKNEGLKGLGRTWDVAYFIYQKDDEMTKKLFVVLISIIVVAMLLSTCANQMPAVISTFTPGATRTHTHTSTHVNTPTLTLTVTPTQTTTPIPLASTEEIKNIFNSEINPLVKQLLAAKDNPDAGLTSEHQIIYVPQTERLYYVQSILQLSRTPDTGTGKKAYVLYNYSRGDTLGYRQELSLDVSSETQEIITSIRLIVEENGKFYLVEKVEATGGSGSTTLVNLVENAVLPLNKLSSTSPSVQTDLEEIIGYACGIDMTPTLDYNRKVALLTFALSGADWAEPFQGIIGLWMLNPLPLESAPALISLLNNNSSQVESAAEDVLTKMAEYPQVLDLLTQAASNPDPEIRKHLPWIFASIETKPDAALAPLMSLFYDQDNSVREYAASALGFFGKPATIPLMNTALEDKDPDIRRFAASVLYEFGPQAIIAVPNLTALLQDADWEVRMDVARALSAIDSQEKSALPALIQAAHIETNHLAFGPEINAVASLSSEADTLPLLKDGLSRSDVGVRMTVCTILRSYEGVPGVVEILILALSDQNAHVRQEAASALAALGPEASQAVPALTKIIQTGKDVNILSTAMYALGQIGPAAKPAVPALIPFINSTDSELRTISLTALKAITNQNFGEDAQNWLDWWKLNNDK
jgi:HEAT repeat protein